MKVSGIQVMEGLIYSASSEDGTCHKKMQLGFLQSIYHFTLRLCNECNCILYHETWYVVTKWALSLLQTRFKGEFHKKWLLLLVSEHAPFYSINHGCERGDMGEGLLSCRRIVMSRHVNGHMSHHEC